MTSKVAFPERTRSSAASWSSLPLHSAGRRTSLSSPGRRTLWCTHLGTRGRRTCSRTTPPLPRTSGHRGAGEAKDHQNHPGRIKTNINTIGKFFCLWSLNLCKGGCTWMFYQDNWHCESENPHCDFETRWENIWTGTPFSLTWCEDVQRKVEKSIYVPTIFYKYKFRY